MSRCLYCYQELGEGETDFHPQCGKKIFGSKTVPLRIEGENQFLPRQVPDNNIGICSSLFFI